MTLPKHAKVPQNRIMRAPYNFVPLPEAVLSVEKPPDQDVYHQDRHTGYIELDIKTETLLYTRCACAPEHADAEIHRTPQRQHFFHYGNPTVPVIPGSSIRGMIRTLVEVLGFCKIGEDLVHKDRLIYRAVADMSSLGNSYRAKTLGSSHPLEYPLKTLKGGYLKRHNGQWHIMPAIEHHGESFVHTATYPAFAPQHPDGAPYGPADVVNVWLRPPKGRVLSKKAGRPPLRLAEVSNADLRPRNNATPPAGAGWEPGVLVRSGHLGNKHRHCVIYTGNTNQTTWIPISDSLWQIYEKDRDMQRGIPCRELKNDGDPLFYLLNPNGTLSFFGPTMMFRLPYNHEILRFIPEALREQNQTDLAEAVFGTTSCKGRVRFGDAQFMKTDDGQSPFLQNGHAGSIILKILSSPKPTSFQNYLVQPIPPESHQNVNDKKRLLLHYEHPYRDNYSLDIRQGHATIKVPTEGTVIRGCKFYWKKSASLSSVGEDLSAEEFNLSPDGIWTNAPDKPQQTVVRPVQPGCRFKSRIHFENLTDLELGVLVAALKLKNEDSRHNLGMGKPFGMGRIRINSELFIENRKARYTSLNMNAQAVKKSVKTAEDVLSVFEKEIKQHYQNKCGGPAVASIWDIPRLQALGLLADKNGPQDAEYVGIDPQGPWRERWVLPTPQQVRGESEIEPLSTPAANTSGLVASGDIVTCVVLEEKTKKEKWKFQVKGGSGIGVLLPESEQPPDIAPGKEYNLTVVSNNPRNMSFRWNP